MTNLKTEIFVLCDHASISQDQKLSIIGIFDQFFVANVPTNWPRMFLVAVLKGEPQKEYPVTLRLIPPVKTDTNFPDKDLKVTLGANGKANLMTELVNFPLSAPGVYKVQLLSDKEKVGELEFTVNKTTATYSPKGEKLPN